MAGERRNDDPVRFRAEVKDAGPDQTFLFLVQQTGPEPAALRGGNLILDLKPGADAAEVHLLASKLSDYLDGVRVVFPGRG